MKLILDTHTYVWWLIKDNQLSQHAIDAIQDESNQIFISSIVIWELMIKKSVKKLRFDIGTEQILSAYKNEVGFEELPITIEHATRVELLPFIHRDPFDRVLIAQALAEGAHLVTADAQIAQYDMPVIW